MKASLSTLETVLDRLDRIGAGIAAIHVDAAINQLKNNLDVVTTDESVERSGSHRCPSEHTPHLP